VIYAHAQAQSADEVSSDEDSSWVSIVKAHC